MSAPPEGPRGAGDPAGPPGVIGKVLAGRYRLASMLGSGRYARVYLADDGHIDGRQVAIKMARSQRGAAAGQGPNGHLLNEARALALVDHPAAPRLLDVLRQDNRVFLVLNY